MTARKSSAKTVQWEDGVREVPLDAAAQWTNEAGWGALDYWTTLRALGLAGLHGRLRETVYVVCDVHPAGLRRKHLVAVGHPGVRDVTRLALRGVLYVLREVTLLLERRLQLVAVLLDESDNVVWHAAGLQLGD